MITEDRRAPGGNHGVIGPGRPLYGQAPTFQGDRSAMSRTSRDQIRKLLDEAEGYLMLDLPRRSLQILGSRPDWSTMQFEANFLKGEALRCLDRYREALKPLEVAASLRPDDTRVALALGWCYKRTNRLAQAIDSLERACASTPTSPCSTITWPATGAWPATAPRRSTPCSTALEIDPELRSLIAEERDFEHLRGTPEFDRLVMGSAPLT